jgi:hypothetical protein
MLLWRSHYATVKVVMAPLNLFIPLTKVDEENRIVYGVATAESLDRSGEVCDYASTKPYYERWSNGIAKSTGGRSLGNVRAMHGKVAAGKLIGISFDDAAKKIAVAAKVVDDGEWSKVLEGVYTGFSHGGRYVRKWTENGTKRYTADPSELSLVDLPCLPEATFEVVKADGATETRGFVAKTFTEEQLAPLAWELAKEAGVTEWEAALELAKNHLAAEQVRKAEIDVGEDVEKWDESKHPRDEEGKWSEASGSIASEAAAGSLSGAVTGAIAGGVAGGPVGAAVGALDGAVLGALGGAVSEGAKQWAKSKEGPKNENDESDENPKDRKGKKNVTEKWVEPTHKQFWSCGCEGHDHEHVTKAEAVACMKDRLAKAEAAELPEVVAAREAMELSKQAMEQLEKKPEGEPDGDEAANEKPEGKDEKPEGEEAPHAEPDGDEAPAEAAKKAISKAVDDLISRDADPIEVMTKMLAKYGARNSSSKDLSVIQAIHDHAAHLGAQCSESEGGAAEKVDAGDLAKLAANNEELRSSLTSVTSQLQELSKRVEVLSRSPAPAKAAVFAVSKAADGQVVGETPEEALLKRMNSMTPEQQQHELMKLALRIPVAPIQ